MSKELTGKDIKEMIEKGFAWKVPAEDLKLYVENLERRGEYFEDALRNLYYAVCQQAVADYHALVHGIPVDGVQYADASKDLKEFIRSNFFVENTHQSDPEKVMENARNIPESYHRVLARS